MKNILTTLLNPLLEEIAARKAEVDALRPLSSEQEGRIMQKFRLDWNYHSNAIEGNSLTYGETIAFLMEGLTAKGKPFKDHLDIKGHNEGIDYLMYFIQNREELTEKSIRELHQMILVEPYTNPAQTVDGQIVEKTVTLGAYKSMPNHVKTPTGEIHYYATPEETPAKMADLVRWLHQQQEKNDVHPVVLAAIFHFRFVAIHPFDDGNGRMSRLLMNLLLMQYGYPPVVIKQQDRQAYYYALRQGDAGDLGSFVEYIGQNLLHSLSIQLKGAKGESLEEEDDLDKEITLLKGSLVEPEVIHKSAKTLYGLLSYSILPLFQEIQKQCRKLDELFFDKWERAQYSSEESNSKVKLGTQDWVATKLEWLDNEPVSSAIDRIFHVEYEYSWKDFKKSRDPFSLNFEIHIQLNRFKYEIYFKGPSLDRKISKLYTENLSKEEFNDLSKIFVKEALAEIKRRTQK